MIPGPFARADFRGLDDVLAALEKAEDEWGEHFEPPLILRRLVAQGRLGAEDAARASTRTRSPTPATRARRSSSTRAATIADRCGSTTRPPTRSPRT